MRFATTTLIAIVAALTTLGFLMLYSAGMQTQGLEFAQKQTVWALLGICCAFVCGRIDYRNWRKFTPFSAAFIFI